MEDLDSLYKNLLLNVQDEPRITPVTFTPHNWLKTAKIYNQKLKRVPSEWLIENADIIVVLFSSKGIDRKGIVETFQDTYENTKYVNLPVEVLNVPLDDTAEDAAESFESQANWFTLLFNDPLVHELKFMYGITCVPYIYVLKPTCEIVSNNGIADLEMYGKNAIVSWLSVSPVATHERKMSRDSHYYGDIWKYLSPGAQKHDYHRKFVVGEFGEDETPDENQEITHDSTHHIANEVAQEVSIEASQHATHNFSKMTSSEQLKTELKDLHYSC